MATFRTLKTSGDFVTVHKDFIYDNRLSAKAKGLLLYLLSRPDDWKIYTTEIVKNMSDGQKSVNAGIQELMEYGYVKRTQIRRKDGVFSGYEYLVYEKSTEMPLSENGLSENGLSENGKGRTTNNNSTNNNTTNNDNTNTSSDDDLMMKEFNEWYELYNHKKDRKKSFTKFKVARKKHSLEEITEGTKKYLSTITNKKYQKYPTTFLNNESYLDEYEEEKKGFQF